MIKGSPFWGLTISIAADMSQSYKENQTLNTYQIPQMKIK
jgi:hypothetical protein